jgi:hypothetical protein
MVMEDEAESTRQQQHLFVDGGNTAVEFNEYENTTFEEAMSAEGEHVVTEHEGTENAHQDQNPSAETGLDASLCADVEGVVVDLVEPTISEMDEEANNTLYHEDVSDTAATVGMATESQAVEADVSVDAAVEERVAGSAEKRAYEIQIAGLDVYGPGPDDTSSADLVEAAGRSAGMGPDDL